MKTTRKPVSEATRAKMSAARAKVMATYGLRNGHGLYFNNLVHEKPVKSILTSHQAV